MHSPVKRERAKADKGVRVPPYQPKEKILRLTVENQFDNPVSDQIWEGGLSHVVSATGC